MDKDAMLVNFSFEKYGEFKLMSQPELGWDILAIMYSDQPYYGNINIPIYVPYSSGGGGSVETRQSSINSTCRVPMFLCAKAKDQCLKERDAKIAELTKTVEEAKKTVEAAQKEVLQTKEAHKLVHGNYEFAEKQRIQLVDDVNKWRTQVQKAEKHFGEATWKVAMGEKIVAQDMGHAEWCKTVGEAIGKA